MAKGYAMDDEVIINLQGIRWVKKSNTYGSIGRDQNFYLTWDFKGAVGITHEYKDVAKRDAMFDQIRNGLAKEQVK